MDIIAEVPALVKWTEKKRQNLKIANKMVDAGFPERGIRMRFCGQYLDMKYCPDCGKSVVSSANLCRDRLCPTCSWRLSLKRFAEMCNAISYINDLDTFDAGFLTLTVRNCAPENLRFTLDQMSKAWNRMRQNRTFKRLLIGSARSVEVTYNKRTNTFHPHFHIIMLYSPHDEGKMRELTNRAWAQACRFDYTPVTDFRVITAESEKGTNIDNEHLTEAILETFKYAVKSDEIENMPIDVFRHLVMGTAGVRMVSYTGVIKEARRFLNYDSDELTDEDGEIIMEKCTCGADLQKAVMKWSFTEKQYILIRDFLHYNY